MKTAATKITCEFAAGLKLFLFIPTLKKLFNGLLDFEEDSILEVDTAHHTLGPRSQDPSRRHDILRLKSLF